MSNIEENKQKVKKMQNVVYEILCDIDRFCRDNKIRYFLSGGTCLGAVRHKGFIPWDDDADLMMPRKDYERFIKLFSKSELMEKYGIGSLLNDPDWTIQYTRVWDKSTKWHSKKYNLKEMGIFIDIFPMDGVPSNRMLRKVFFARLKVLCEFGKEASRVEFSDDNRFLVIRKIVGFFTRPIGQRYFSKRLNAIAKKYDFDKSKYVACSMPVHYGEKEVIEYKNMNKATFLQFEDRRFPVPVGYEKYLTNLYGNYMDIPKDAAEKGFSHLDKWEVDF